ncbi:hypothetical protein GYMLUDRAFT_240898 [Collybiopsis luxurians FD-317 M1]|nr:hypothetical protein GYMLUDRAFT_240898 [Collybiopsis luxurians FD-317 M1]
MRKITTQVKKFFGKKKNQNVILTGNASPAAPEYGTVLQAPFTNQSDIVEGRTAVGLVTPSLTSALPALHIRMQGLSTNQQEAAVIPESRISTSSGTPNLRAESQGPSTTRFPIASGTVVDTLETTLMVLKEISVPFAPLQGAVGGIIECIHIYKKVSGNTEALQALAEDLSSMTRLIHQQLNKDGIGTSEEQIFQVLANKLDGITEKIKTQKQTSNFMKVVQKNQIADRIETFKREVQSAYQECQMKLISAIETDIGKILEAIALKELKHASKAYYDADIGAKYVRRACHADTRVKIIEDIEKWASDSNSTTGYWICGMAGTGKSTIAMSVCESLKAKGTLAGSFFCSRQIPECKEYWLIIPTLAYQLANYSRRFAVALRGILSKYPDISAKKPEEQVYRLLIEPCQELMVTPWNNDKLPVVVLDALDECQDIELALKPLMAAIQGHRLHKLKFLLTSRPEPEIGQLVQFHESIGPVIEFKEFILHSVGETEKWS